MSETNDKKEKKTLSLGGKTLSLGGGGGSPAPARSRGASGGRSGVAVEVKRRRTTPVAPAPEQEKTTEEPQKNDLKGLTEEERDARIRALKQAEEDAKNKKDDPTSTFSTPRRPSKVEQGKRELEELERQAAEEEERKRIADLQAAQVQDPTGERHHHASKGKHSSIEAADEAEEESYRERMKKQAQRRPTRGNDDDKRRGKITVTQALNEDYDRDRGPSMAAQKRAREKARLAALENRDLPEKVVREVVVPEVITVQELANRMAERGADVVKELMKLGVMATINQTIDADTAELIITEMGHKIKRVTDADVEVGLDETEDAPKDLLPRPPVVTIMGHVDHGKTSLLDALRSTDVVSGEAGGITQHIGAYQVTLASGDKITFLDTPGHAAFTEMRARGANVTDIVVIVVAANDSIMPQTIEAINHAKAAEVPIIIAINKIDLPDANPQKVKSDLLSHEIVIEDMGGDTLCIEVSAMQKTNLDKLEEMILLQSEVLELKANPNRRAIGTVVEAKLEQGRGNVATVLVEKGTLRIGDVFCVGSEWGKVRALVDDHGNSVKEAIPGQPVEVLGLNGAPEAGDKLNVGSDEAQVREISEYRQRKKREMATVKAAKYKGTFEELLHAENESKKKALSLIIRGDVHGSVEALVGSLLKIEEENEDVKIRILHTGVGGITESDVTLALASGAVIVGFNVRANAKAREMAEREKIDMRYYNIIYNVIDDVKAVLSGMLAPTEREEYLGQAEIRQVFRITKAGNIAGCMVTRGNVERGAKVRLLRDDVVIHEGTLKTLKRFKDEAKEVKEGMECGMAFENYDDIKERDIIECYRVVEEARTVE